MHRLTVLTSQLIQGFNAVTLICMLLLEFVFDPRSIQVV